MEVQAILVDRLVDGIDVVVGMEVIGRLGSVTVHKQGTEFCTRCAACYEYKKPLEGCWATERV